MNDEEAIRELVRAWLKATKAGDTKTLLRLMADDVVFMVPGQEPFGKEAFAEATNAMNNVKIEAESDIKEIQVIGGWAWMRNRLALTSTPSNGKPSYRSGYTLTILRKKPDGVWVVARDANLLASSPT